MVFSFLMASRIIWRCLAFRSEYKLAWNKIPNKKEKTKTKTKSENEKYKKVKMGLKLENVLPVFMFLLLASTAKAQTVFDVTSAKYGGKPNSDITQVRNINFHIQLWLEFISIIVC